MTMARTGASGTDRYGGVEGLIARLGDVDFSSSANSSANSRSDSTSVSSMYASTASSSASYASSNRCEIVLSDSEDKEHSRTADDAFACSSFDLAAARNMYLLGIGHVAARTCESHPFALQKETSNGTGDLTTLVSALEPVDYSEEADYARVADGILLRRALLSAGIVESCPYGRFEVQSARPSRQWDPRFFYRLQTS